MLLRVVLSVALTAQRKRLRGLLTHEDLHLRVVDSLEDSWQEAVNTPCDVLVVEHSVIPKPAVESIAGLADRGGAPAVIVVSDRLDTESSTRLRAAGAEAILDMGVPDKTLSRALLATIGERRNLLAKTVAARRFVAQPRLSDFVSTSPSMQRFLRTVRCVVDSDAPILITGETGVGKERLARAIHSESRRGDGAFISVNCGAIPENLLESQLFGHEKGAFTGATRTQRGCFELAHGGTIFLDEIAEMSVHLQVKLLHILQDYEVKPIGSERSFVVDVRVIAATNRDITELINEKRFRQDLYFRLNVVPITVPPLRDRKDDIPALAESFVGELSTRIGREVKGISKEAMARLRDHDWPGNVRELINVLERSVLLSDGPVITLEDLPLEITGPSEDTSLFQTPPGGEGLRLSDEWLARPLREVREAAIARAEAAYLAGLLEKTGGKVGKAALMAGIEARSLFTKMRHYGLRKEDFRRKPRTA